MRVFVIRYRLRCPGAGAGTNRDVYPHPGADRNIDAHSAALSNPAAYPSANTCSYFDSETTSRTAGRFPASDPVGNGG
jgi:hypothetical protein